MKALPCELSSLEILTDPLLLRPLRGSDGEPVVDPEDAEEDSDNEHEEDEQEEQESEDEPDSRDKRIASLEEEKQRHYDRRKAAESEVAKLKDEVATLKKNGVTDEQISVRNDELTSENSNLRSTNERLALQNAFLASNEQNWVDPEAAFQLIDLGTVEIDEKTGKVHGMTSALAALAKAKPYLLKADEDAEARKPRKSGTAPKGGKNTDSEKKAREAALRAKYPGLRR